MSIVITPNASDPLVAESVKSSNDWELIKIKGSGGDKKTVALFPSNFPTGIQAGDSFRVTEIEGFKYSSKKDARGIWRDNISLTVKAEKVGGMPREMRHQPRTTEYQGSAPQWSPPPREEAAPMFELDGDDEGLPF